MSDLPFAVVGRAPESWTSDLGRLAERLAEHPWGGASLDLVLVGELPKLLSEYMPPSRFVEWQAGYEAGRIAVTGAISFAMADGRRAAAVPEVDDRSIFLMLAGHELVEAALERRHEAEGHEFVDGTHTSLAHVLWTEYVVERTRRQLFTALDLGYSGLDRGFLSEQVAEIASELPGLVRWAVLHNDLPQRMIQLWYELARVYAMSLGRADEGSSDDLEDLTRFMEHALVQESQPGWDALSKSLRQAYERPTVPANELDQLVRNEGWMPLYEGGLASVWNPRYEAAGGG
jgi:hypothetical protein